LLITTFGVHSQFDITFEKIANINSSWTAAKFWIKFTKSTISHVSLFTVLQTCQEILYWMASCVINRPVTRF